MMASSEVDVVAGSLAMATKDGALNHPAPVVVTKWLGCKVLGPGGAPCATGHSVAASLNRRTTHIPIMLTDRKYPRSHRQVAAVG